MFCLRRATIEIKFDFKRKGFANKSQFDIVILKLN